VTPTLITIGFSHYCEKARWALDRAELDYVERDHPPILHYRDTFRVRAGRLVPVLLTDGGLIRESSEIVRFADRALPSERRLFPDEPALAAEVASRVDEYDRSLGPATRRALYHLALDDTARARELLGSTGRPWERRAARLLFAPIRVAIVRGLKITKEGATRSLAKIDALFAETERLLADGRRFLTGDRFTAADLTFASLAAPALIPPQYGYPLPFEALPPRAQEWVAKMRATPAGQFALRTYASERPPVRARERSDALPS